MFRKFKIGTLVGQRTWGGLVSVLGCPTLMDGGTITAPNLAIWTAEEGWVVQNEGVPPEHRSGTDTKGRHRRPRPAARAGDRRGVGGAEEEPAAAPHPSSAAGTGEDTEGHDGVYAWGPVIM
jgi:C-terminal processing protease CtpA/Prc